MARPLRIDYEGAIHHVMNRGTNRCPIFMNDQDRRSFLDVLGELEAKCGVEVHAYCLMGNHYHLLLRTAHGNLSRAMRQLDGVYTQRFNRVHERDGPLFRGRYASVLVEHDIYFARLSRYIHLNPLRARLVERLDRYRWSSYPSFVGPTRSPEWLHTDLVLEALGSPDRYRVFVEDQATDDELSVFYRKQRHPPVLGGTTFKHRVLKAAKEDRETALTRLLSHEPVEFDTIEQCAADTFGVSVESLFASTRGQVNIPRMAAIALCQRYGRATLGELSQRYGFKNYTGAASAIRRLDELAERDCGLAARLQTTCSRIQASW